MVELFPKFIAEKPYESLPAVSCLISMMSFRMVLFVWGISILILDPTLNFLRLKVAEDKSLVELFSELTYDDLWDDCSDLRDVLVYCRGSKRLRIPSEWRGVLPTEL